MRGFYGLPPREFSRALRALAGIEHVTLEDRHAVLLALEAFDKRLDFADALHVTRAARVSGFLTFDKRLSRQAMRLALATPVELLV